MFTKRLFIGATIAASAAALNPSTALASSHREAPLLLEDPAVDATDLYAWRSGGNVVIVANYVPFETPSGGPNFHRFSDNAVYRINVDNNQDAVADIVYEFRFRTTVANPDTFLYNTGLIATGMPANVRQLMTVTRTAGTTTTTLATDVEVAPAYVGRHSFAAGPSIPPSTDAAAGDTAYDNYVNANNIHMLTGITGGRVFAGPRDDPFFADLGALFDLLRIRPMSLPAMNVGNQGGGVDHLAGYNVHSIVMEVPVTEITGTASIPTDPAARASVMGVWTTAHRPRVRVLRGSTNEEHHGQLVQVSRLGNPLINEVLLPLSTKNLYLGSSPAGDLSNFATFLLSNQVTALLNTLYLTPLGIPATAEQTMSTTMPGVADVLLNVMVGGNPMVAPSDQLHFNAAIPVNPFPDPATVNTLTVFSGSSTPDTLGYPNGRRLADDVVDILVRVLGGGVAAPTTAAGQLGDGVNQNDVAFNTTFPFLARPHEGYAQGRGLLTPASAPRLP